MDSAGPDVNSPETSLRLIHFIPRDNRSIQTQEGRIDLGVDVSILETDIASRLPELRSPHDINVYFGARPLAEVLVDNFGGNRDAVELRKKTEDLLFGEIVGLFSRDKGKTILYLNIPRVFAQIASERGVKPMGVLPTEIAEVWAHEVTHLLQLLDPTKNAVRLRGVREEKIVVGGAAISCVVLGGLAGMRLRLGENSERVDPTIKSPSRRKFLKIMVGAAAGAALAPLGAGAAGSAHYHVLNEAEIEAREAAQDRERIDFLRRAFTFSRVEG